MPSLLSPTATHYSSLNAGTPHKALMTALSAKWHLQKAAAEVSTVSDRTDLGLKMEQLCLQEECR